MKNKIILLITLFFFGSLTAKADSISSINMDIKVKENGDADIVETWKVNINNGTEGYKPYYNIGNSEFTNFSVSDTHQEYQNIGSWDTSVSFNTKKYRNGIHQIYNGLELCWGISNYGNNTYTLKYTITNFVRELSDKQMIYWTLIPYELSSKPETVSIKIHSDFKYAKDLPVWGFGTYGTPTYVYDGYIEMIAEDGLSSSEYMTILAEFPLNTFQTTNVHSDEKFDDYLTRAKDGSNAYKKNNREKTISNVINILPSMISTLLPFIVFFLAAKSITSTKKNGISFKFVNKKIPKDIPNFRDIPCNKNVSEAFFISYNYDLMKNKNDYLGALLLKWLKEKKITIGETESKILHKKQKTIEFKSSDPLEDALENELYTMMKEASLDGILEENEFTKWCKEHYKRILKWFDDVSEKERDSLVETGLLQKCSGKFGSIKYENTPALKEEAIKLKGLKNFLVEFSRMDEKIPLEVNIWEYYLIYAQIFGIADEVSKQFKKLYPDLITDTNYDYDTFIFIHHMSYSGMTSASVAKSRAESYSSYGSGGGGFSSGGGGGGSFGGGGGGGGFR